MGGSYRRGCQISRLEDQCKQRVGGLENEVDKGGRERTHSLFMFAGGNAEGNVTLFMTQLSLSVRGVTGACVFRLFETSSSSVVEKSIYKSLGNYFGTILLLIYPEGFGDSEHLTGEQQGAGWTGSHCSPTSIILEDSLKAGCSGGMVSLFPKRA